MSPFSLFVVYLLIWWVTLFAVLPMGVRGQAEEGDVVKGSEPGAPVNSDMKRKVIITTIAATIMWVIVCSIIWSGALNWDMMAEWLNIDKLAEE
jgi:predicted secreted protein